ncbi:hypothetical protein D3C84_782710 [compost metagenome]
MASRIAASRLIIGAAEPSAVSGTLSRGTTSATGAVEMEIWLSNMNASIRNQVLVTEITAMNQIDQMPLRRWKSPQKIRAPWRMRRVGRKKPFQKRLYTTSPVIKEASSGRLRNDTRYQPQL